jgi:hypothetical protein
MAVFAFTDGFLLLNAGNLSAYCKKIELDVDVDALDSTAMGPGWKSSTGGIKSGTLALTLNDDVAAAAIDSILWPLLGTVVTFEVRATSGARSTSNPAYTGSVLISGHQIGGSVGDLAAKDLSFPTSGAVSRATS